MEYIEYRLTGGWTTSGSRQYGIIVTNFAEWVTTVSIEIEFGNS